VCARGPLVETITAFVSHGRASAVPDIRASLERTIDEAGPEAIQLLSTRLARAGTDWSYYPRDPLARRIHHVLAGSVLQQEPVIAGTEHLAAIAGKPLVMIGNHLSYSDANAIEVLLQRAGWRALADRLTVVAGPKVYSNVRRRFSSLCFGTIKVPQSTGRSSDEAVMNARDVARAARRSIQIAHERLRLGEALLVFPEGTRSRSGRMQPFLPGVARYLEPPDAWVLPFGITGTEQLFSIEGDSLQAAPIALRFGRPVATAVLREEARGNRRLIMDSIGFAIAALLPHTYRGAYGPDAAPDDESRTLGRKLFG
jgi:1-acyl-sn-glycerol-3-phosphate acyltransferase